MDGLMNSLIVAPVISKAALAPLVDLKKSSACDNVVLEHWAGFELVAQGKLQRDFPILVGEMEKNDRLGERCTDFFQGRKQKYPEAVVEAIQKKLIGHLARQETEETLGAMSVKAIY